jgi:glycerol kinase
MSKCILTVDEGTTNAKALLVSETGEIIARASRPVSICYPKPAWVEQDPMAVLQSLREAMDECLEQLGPQELAAVAVTNQRETVMLWERATGKSTGPCAVWQCTRGNKLCTKLRERGFGAEIRRTTGLTIDPMFSASKAHWLLDHLENGMGRAAAGELCVGTMDSWVLWNLTGRKVHATDTTNASRTQLFDLRVGRWSERMGEIFGIPLGALAEVRDSAAQFGETEAIGRLPAGIPITSLIGDSHAAYFGHAAFRTGTVKATYGTGSSLMSSTTEVIDSSHGLSSTVAFSRAGRITFALEGNIYATGAAVQWFGDFLGLDDSAASVANLAMTVVDNGGICLVPAFVGLGAPHWNDKARGLITGLTRGTTRAHVARAAVESIAFQIRDVFAAMESDSGSELPELLADGGASQNDALMQFQADILDRPVLRSASADLSALGAAYLAGLQTGIWKSLEEIEALPRSRDRFEPKMSASDRDSLLTGWQEAVARAVVRV